LKIHYIIILIPKSGSSKWLFSFSFPQQHPVCTYHRQSLIQMHLSMHPFMGKRIFHVAHCYMFRPDGHRRWVCAGL